MNRVQNQVATTNLTKQKETYSNMRRYSEEAVIGKVLCFGGNIASNSEARDEIHDRILNLNNNDDETQSNLDVDLSQCLVVALKKGVNCRSRFFRFEGSPAKISSTNSIVKKKSKKNPFHIEIKATPYLNISGKIVRRVELLKNADVCLSGRIDSDTLRLFIDKYSTCDRVLYLQDEENVVTDDESVENRPVLSDLNIELSLKSCHWGRHGLVFGTSDEEVAERISNDGNNQYNPPILLNDVERNCPACPIYNAKDAFVGKEVYRAEIVDTNISNHRVVSVDCDNMSVNELNSFLQQYALFPVRKLYLRNQFAAPTFERISRNAASISLAKVANANRLKKLVHDDAGSINSEDSSKSEDRECVVCFGVSNTIFQPCSHVCCCESCAKKLEECPLCRARIRKVQIFDI